MANQNESEGRRKAKEVPARGPKRKKPAERSDSEKARAEKKRMHR